MKTELERQDLEAIANEVAKIMNSAQSKKGEKEEIIFDVQGLAEYLKVDLSWIYKQVSLKAIPFFKVGKYTRFKQSAIDKWTEQNSHRPLRA